jgi:hypothetical protein
MRVFVCSQFCKGTLSRNLTELQVTVKTLFHSFDRARLSKRDVAVIWRCLCPACASSLCLFA